MTDLRGFVNTATGGAEKINSSTDRKLTNNYSDKSVVFQAERTLLLFLFPVFYHCELNIIVFRTVGQKEHPKASQTKRLIGKIIFRLIDGGNNDWLRPQLCAEHSIL